MLTFHTPRSAPRGPRARRALAVLAVLVLCLLLGAPGPAAAHATLVASEPPDGARLDTGPAEVHLTFSEHVSGSLGGIRVVDADGTRVDRGAVRVAGPEASVDLAADLPDGTYVVTYRVISADGHPVRGSSVFAVGDAAVDESVARSASAGGNDRTWELLGKGGRALAYGGTLLAAGGALFLLFADRTGARRRGLRRLLALAALVGAIGSLVALPVQAALGTGTGVGSLFEPGVLDAVLADGVGLALGLCLAGLVLTVLALERHRGVATAAAVVAAGSFAATGHTRVGDLASLSTAADAVHLVVVAVWAGGGMFLWLTLRGRRTDDADGDDRAATAATVVRFSSLATIAVVAAGITGGFLAWDQVRTLRALSDTWYGQLLVAKVVTVGVIAGIGAYNHFRLLPALEQGKVRAALQRMRTVLRAEAVLLVVVVALTSVLVVVTPGRTAAEGGPVERIIELGDVGSVQLVVAPARAGTNQIHLYTFDPEGRPAELADTIEIDLSLPSADIGPLERTATRAGPAHAQLNGNDLALAGRWQITVRVRIDRFTEASGTTEVPVSG